MPPPRQGLAKGSHGPPQLKQLEEFGALLKAGMLGAVRADQADLALEGEFWLVEIQGEAFPAPASMALATDVFEEGYLIVKVKWYDTSWWTRRGGATGCYPRRGTSWSTP